MSQFLKILSLLSLITYLNGCGQMGPLYLPKDDQTNQSSKSTSNVTSNSVSNATSSSDHINQSKES
ncbi:MAG: hypothetical protein EP298_10530 [Gammaproteobacteria bacterium]|nr:MAG: hypothetical protein EP298_10530 [Gammaproteobacteria bacterium]